jgi:hypothetical protein
MLPLTAEAYEGGLQILGPSVATLTASGIANPSTYGGPSGRIQVLFNAYKNDARCKQLILDLFNDFVAPSHSMSPSWYNFVGDNSEWSLYPGDLYSTPFQPFNAIAQFDAIVGIGGKNLKGHF